MRILALCGSLQAKSANRTLLEHAAARMSEGVDVVLYDGIRDLPLFNPDLSETPPSAVLDFRRALSGADAVLIASPEYGHSLPGALKNAIDWVIGSGELYQKPVAVTAATASAERGVRGLQALCQTLRGVDATIVGGAPIVRGASYEGELDALLASLIATARAERPRV